MTTPHWWDFVPNSTLYRILSGFHITFATGVACRQGTLTPPDTWSRPFGTCICCTCGDQSFSELVVILPDYALRISLGTFSILLFFVLEYSLSIVLVFFTFIIPGSRDIVQVVQTVQIDLQKFRFTEPSSNLAFVIKNIAHNFYKMQKDHVVAFYKIIQ